MFSLALDFLIGALVAATFGFGGIIASSADAARVLALAFFLAFLILLLPGPLRAIRRRRPHRSRRTRSAIPLIRVRGNKHDDGHARIGA